MPQQHCQMAVVNQLAVDRQIPLILTPQRLKPRQQPHLLSFVPFSQETSVFDSTLWLSNGCWSCHFLSVIGDILDHQPMRLVCVLRCFSLPLLGFQHPSSAFFGLKKPLLR